MPVIAIELEDEVAILTMSAPEKRNALSRRLLGDLRNALLESVDRGARAVVLTGAGASFSAGADLDELTGTGADVAIDAATGEATEALQSCPLPVVAAIEGACVGAAVDLALACDVRIVAADGYFAVPAVALGILYNPAALGRIAGRVSHETLARLLLLGERIGGEEAVAAGLAGRVVPSGDALAESLVLARRAAQGAPEAAAATKSVLTALAAGRSDPADWEEIRHALLASDARAERVRAAQDRLQRTAVEGGQPG